MSSKGKEALNGKIDAKYQLTETPKADYLQRNMERARLRRDSRIHADGGVGNKVGQDIKVCKKIRETKIVPREICHRKPQQSPCQFIYANEVKDP